MVCSVIDFFYHFSDHVLASFQTECMQCSGCNVCYTSGAGDVVALLDLWTHEEDRYSDANLIKLLMDKSISTYMYNMYEDGETMVYTDVYNI